MIRFVASLERYMKARLAWHRFYRAVSYARSTLWIMPFVAIVVVLVVAPLVRTLDEHFGFRIIGLGVAGAQTLYQTVITLTLSFMVFTFGSLLVAIQVAGGQMTPRIIATTLLRDNVVRGSVGLFVFTLMFSVMSLDRLVDKVHELLALIGAILGVACMVTFLFLIDYAARLLRPVSVLTRVGESGLAVIEAVYPTPFGEAEDARRRRDLPAMPPPRIVRHAGNSGIVLAVDVQTLMLEARRRDGIVELIPQVGDFVTHDDPVFALHRGASAIDERRLRATVAFGAERTLEQDPLFAFRIVVDIALKALSPAINDPTTAVLALDQVHRLLRAVGQRHLQSEGIADDRGDTRVILRTPDWDDFVHIACHEIRMCGAGSVQIARRLRAMLDNLAGSLPADRARALELERGHLDRMIETLYPIAEDRALARQADSQGLGASSAAAGSR